MKFRLNPSPFFQEPIFEILGKMTVTEITVFAIPKMLHVWYIYLPLQPLGPLLKVKLLLG